MRSAFPRVSRFLGALQTRYVSTKDIGAQIALPNVVEEKEKDLWQKVIDKSKKSRDEYSIKKVKAYNECFADARLEVENGSWYNFQITGGNGEVLLDRSINIRKVNLGDGGLSNLLQSGNSNDVQNISPQQIELNKKALEAIASKGQIELPQLGDSFGCFKKISKDDERLVKKIAIGKYIEREIDVLGTINGNMLNNERARIALLTSLDINFDLKNGVIAVNNLEEVKEKYLKTFSSRKDEKDFEYEVRDLISGITSGLGGLKDEKDKFGIGSASLFRDKEFDKHVARLLKAGRGKVHKTSIIVDEKKSDRDTKTHLVNSPFLHDDILNFGGDIVGLLEYQRQFSKSFLFNAIVEEAAKEAYGEKDFAKFFKQMRRSLETAAIAFPRDYSICHNGVFYQTDENLSKAISDSGSFLSKMLEQKNSSTFEERISSHKSDLELNGFDVVQNIPFDAKGGNMIITKNSQGKSVLLATVSDSYFDDKGDFVGGYVVEGGSVKDLSDGLISKVFGSNYPKFCEQIKDWGKSIGCDEVIVLDRNIGAQYRFKDLYHLDVFCGTLPDGYLVINPEAISKENMKELKKVFGEDKIINISKEEQKELCANFIVFNRMVVASSPNTPQSFIDKMNEVGFDVYVPSIELTKDETKKAGWPAGVRCLTISTSDAPKNVIDLNRINENSENQNIGPGIINVGAQKLLLSEKTKDDQQR